MENYLYYLVMPLSVNHSALGNLLLGEKRRELDSVPCPNVHSFPLGHTGEFPTSFISTLCMQHQLLFVHTMAKVVLIQNIKCFAFRGIDTSSVCLRGCLLF